MKVLPCTGSCGTTTEGAKVARSSFIAILMSWPAVLTTVLDTLLTAEYDVTNPWDRKKPTAIVLKATKP